MANSRIVDFLAGCMVGGALIAVGVMLGKRMNPPSPEELHVAMLKDGTPMVWAVDRTTGKLRFVSAAEFPSRAVIESSLSLNAAVLHADRQRMAEVNRSRGVP